MAITLQSVISSLLLLFAFLKCSTLAQQPDDTETWKGRRRLVVLEDIYPLKKERWLRWVRGWDCGWTPYGLCFSPDWRRDIHDHFIISFENLIFSVYVDEPANPNEFGLNSAVLVRFSKKKTTLWEARVKSYFTAYNWAKHKRMTYQINVKTEYQDLAVQLSESFHPSQVLLKGAHDACRYFETECKSYEKCVPRRLSAGHIWPGVYKCACTKKGWHDVPGRGCMDKDECEQSPCGALFVCVNTIGSYKCHCRPGYKGSKCDVEIDACKKNPCPANRICEDTPERFQCSCLPGFTGKNCSEPAGTGETMELKVRTTLPSIQELGNKRIAIPRKKPTKVLRKPVFSYDPRRSEVAVMSIFMVLLNGLGIYLYWSQRKKRAKNRKNDKGASQSSKQDLTNDEPISINQVLESTDETFPNIQELNLGETILNYQQLENSEVTSKNDELKMKSETSQRNEEIDGNETIQSDKEVGGDEVNLRNNELENTESFSRNQELQLSETFSSNEDSEIPDRFPNNPQELKLSEAFSSNQDLDSIATISSKQEMDDAEIDESNLTQ